MQATGGMTSLPRRIMRATVPLGLLFALGLAQMGLAQTNALNFGNNYFVTGDYVLGGVGLRGTGVNGFATGTINIPDANPGISGAKSVPQGAQIVAAFLYWQTVEGSQAEFAGQNGFFRPLFPGGPTGGYPITGVRLGNPNAPVSWSSGGCSGNAQGSKTMRVYRADVRPYLRVDGNGDVLANGSYEVRLADSGSSGAGTPLTLGATLVIIYRVISPDFPLNSVVMYEGAYAPANGSDTMTQSMQGFYQAATSDLSRISKLTHIVGNGQTNKFQTAYLNNVALPSLYGGQPTFPGYYNGSWDNPTWGFSGGSNPVAANAASATTMVAPTSTNSGCVSWGAIILSTTIQDGDNDGLLDVWEQNQGYCNASVNEGVCSAADPSWVALPGATPNQRDLFAQIDYLCSIVNPDGTCDTTNGHSHLPPPAALAMVTSAFAPRGINLHLIPTNAIPEQTCTDNTPSCGDPVLTPYPNQSGVVGWKGGFAFLKNQPLNYPDENSCETATNPPCIRRFQGGRKDSYHYVIAAHALGVANWGFPGGSLTGVVVDGNGVATFNTNTPPGFSLSNPAGLVAGDMVSGNGRVTVVDAITSPNLNGTYFVTGVSNVEPYGFTIQTTNVPAGTYTINSDPDLSVGSGKASTGSGFSDIGGADSLITLGLWGPDGQTVSVQAGTFMHEFGHSIALTHGGFFYDTPGSYVATAESNCKSNFQSVMNYLFQVDLLDGVVDYSGQNLATLNEQTLSGIMSLMTAITNLPATYSETKWYTPLFPGGGTAATRHCDGTPLAPLTDPQPTMYRVEGVTNLIAPAWSNSQDINFDGAINASLRGYNDWVNMDLRQIGATGSLSTVGGGSLSKGGGSLSKGGGSLSKGGGSLSKGGGSLSKGGGVGELTFEVANSVTRPPRNLTASLTPPPRYIRLNWMAPTFGTIGSYNIYKAANGTPVAPAYASVSGSTLTFTDQDVICGPTYTYFVTAVLAGTSQESVPSNSVSLTACAPPYTFTGFYRPMETADPPNTGSYSGTFNPSKSITAKWTLQDSNGNLVTDVNANTLVAVGPFQPLPDGSCRPTQVNVYAACSASNSCPANAVVLFSPAGSKGSSSLRLSGSQFVFNWDTKVTPPSPTLGPCYVLELDLDSGQVERTGVKLQ